MAFSLERFEHQAYNRQQESAAGTLKLLLELLDSNFGHWGEHFSYELAQIVQPEEKVSHVATRIAGAISALFSDPAFFLTPNGFSQLITWQRWLSAIFAASSYRNADHVIRALNANGHDVGSLVLQDERHVIKFCLLYTAESEITLDIDALWAYNRQLAVALCFALLSSRFMGSRAAHAKRETLLLWLPPRLHEVGDLDLLPTSILHDVYMHCSYADLPGKHRIKQSISHLIRKKLLASGFHDLEPPPPPAAGTKPVILLVLEWFSADHSVYRVLAVALRALRPRFTLVAVGFESMVDVAGKSVFDEFVPVPLPNLSDQIELVRDVARRVCPQILLFPSLGMSLLAIYTANMRLAPVQAFAFGHPATSHSDTMDYFIVEEDFVGDPSCFSEKLLRLEACSLPFVPSSRLPENLHAFVRRQPDTVRIVVPASLMKLNPEFLDACRKISERAATPVHFHFLVGLTEGLVQVHVQDVVRRALGNVATVYPHLSYDRYMSVIGKCDMFLSPFPFGNGNGVVDVLTFCLAGVCRSGREVCEHVDHGLFERAGLPSWLVTTTTEDFVAAAVRLADHHEERVGIREKLIAENAVLNFFTGHAEALGEHLMALIPGSDAGDVAA